VLAAVGQLVTHISNRYHAWSFVLAGSFQQLAHILLGARQHAPATCCGAHGPPAFTPPSLPHAAAGVAAPGGAVDQHADASQLQPGLGMGVPRDAGVQGPRGWQQPEPHKAACVWFAGGLQFHAGGCLMVCSVTCRLAAPGIGHHHQQVSKQQQRQQPWLHAVWDLLLLLPLMPGPAQAALHVSPCTSLPGHLLAPGPDIGMYLC
jgi:hypothetical protein